jgi:hypothetical protein
MDLKEMTNEMIRPCTLWGGTFDAMGAIVLPSGRDLGVYTKNGTVFRFEFATREALDIGYMEAITAIADALNAPVFATEEVLNDLPKDANVVSIKNGRIIGQMVFDLEKEQCTFGHIQAFRCSKAVEYLLQFTLDGVRRFGNA